MQKITDKARVREMIREKQALEVRLAWDLLEVFNNPAKGFIGRLRQMVAQSVEFMDRIAKGDGFPYSDQMKFKDKWTSSWNKYACCTDNGIIDWNPEVIKFKSKKFIAQHCADWIRIFGEVIEEIAKGAEDKARTGFQKGEQEGDHYHWTKYSAKVPGDQPGAGRRRVTEDDRKKGNVAVLTDYAGADNLSVWGFMRDISPSAGINRWRIMERDTIGKMDQVFGLMPGATISGTTTDNIYFFNHFQGTGLDPVFYLLPLATIVAPGHHSLLEVALPLSLNGYGEYRVGLYSTLFPKGSQNENRPAGVFEIGHLLDIAERDWDNHLMLVYYKGNQPEGCFLYDEWPKMCWGTDLLRQFRTCPAWPNENEVSKMKPSLGLG